jgi:hypothetical protein
LSNAASRIDWKDVAIEDIKMDKSGDSSALAR